MGQLPTRKMKFRLGAGFKNGKMDIPFRKNEQNEKSLFYAGLRDLFG